MFAFIKTKDGPKLKRIVLRGDMAYKITEITPMAKYSSVKLGEFQSSGDLIADTRARFEDPVMVKLDREKLIQLIGAKRIRVADAEKFPSRRGSDGYVDPTDWRIIRGLLIRPRTGKMDDGTEWGVFTLIDDSVEEEPRVAPDGTILTPGLTCWVSPHMLIYEEESEIDALGTVEISRKTGEAFMNCYLILPVHARRRSGGL